MTRTTIKDGRRKGFFQVIKEDIRALENVCESQDVTVKLAAVRSVYFALLEFANDDRADETNVTRAGLSVRAGVSSRTCQEATNALVIAGLLHVEEMRGAGSTGNSWTLLDAPNRQPLPVQTGSHCRVNRQPLPVPIETGQEEQNNPLPPEGVVRVSDPVERIFTYWAKVMKHPRAKLDSNRRHVIERALKDGTTPEECARAILGCSKSDYHMARGQFRGGTVYDKVSLILRNREQIETFGATAPQTPTLNASGALESSVDDAKIDGHKLNVRSAHGLAGSGEAKRKGDESEEWLEQHGIKTVRDPDGRPRFETTDES